MTHYVLYDTAAAAQQAGTDRPLRNAITFHAYVAGQGVYGLDASTSLHAGYWARLSAFVTGTEAARAMTSDEFYEAVAAALAQGWVTLEAPPNFGASVTLPDAWVAKRWRTEYLRRKALDQGYWSSYITQLNADPYFDPFSTDTLDNIITMATAYIRANYTRDDAAILLEMLLHYGAMGLYADIQNLTSSPDSTATSAPGVLDAGTSRAAGSAV